MLVVTSNWAVADGTLVDPPPRWYAERFCAELRRSAVQAGFRRDGRYRPIDRIEIVLAGDTFDWLLTDAWLGGSRPWQHARRSGPVSEQVMARSLRRAARPLAGLARMVRHGLPVPAADFRGRPIVGSAIRVPVRATLLAGDRDALLQEPRSRLLAERFGMGVGECWTNGAIAVCHGDAFDPLCGRPPRAAAGDRPPTLHESIVVDLLAEFGAMLRDRRAVSDGGRRLMRSLAAVHPLDLPRRLTAWLQRTDDRGEAADTDRDGIVTVWHRAVAQWHRRARRQAPATAIEFDAVEEIAAWMDRLDGAAASGPAGGLHELVDTAHAAVVPPAGGGDAVRFAVFGHLSQGFTTSIDDPSAVRICLGPRPVRRSFGLAALVRSPAVDVACIAPMVGGGEQEPRSVTIFEPGEAGGSDTFVRAADQDALSDSQASGGAPEGVRIVDAA